MCVYVCVHVCVCVCVVCVGEQYVRVCMTKAEFWNQASERPDFLTRNVNLQLG